MELTREQIDKYFEAESEYFMKLYPYKEIVIRRYHMKEWDACNFADSIEGNPLLDFKIYSDKKDYRYSYVEVWKVAERDADYIENIREEFDEDGERKSFDLKRQGKLNDILSHLTEKMTVKELEELIRKIENEKYKGEDL